MKKRTLVLVLAVALVATLSVGLIFGLAACNSKEADREVKLDQLTKQNVKIGLICLHDENSTYDKNFIDAMETARTNLGLATNQVVIKKNIPEGPECYDAAVDLVGQGCNIIFADSFGHEDYMMQAAWEYPTVRFCHATGTKARTANYGNYYNAFASIYEGRYLAGVVAGLKLKEMGYGEGGSLNNATPKVGYVGAFTYAEVISGYTSWFLGVRSIVPGATMDVRFTGSWYNETAEKEAATALINGGCVLISQHADSMGAPTACKEKNVPNVTYNISTEAECSGTYIGGSRINWAPYYEYVVNQAIAGKPIAYDYVGTLATGSVELLQLGTAAPQGAQDTINALVEKLEKGELDVFDLDNFTVNNGQKLTADFLADVVTDDAFVADTMVVENGHDGLVFKESNKRSAPYFDVQIDGITLINKEF